MKNQTEKTARKAVLSNRANTHMMIERMVELALLTALVVVLQLVGTFVRIGELPMSLVLVPIVIGACILGPKAGAFLGFVFGMITMIAGITGADAFSAMLFNVHPVWFVVICLLKATAAGLGAGMIYKLLGKAFGGNYVTVRTVLASISAPILNTGIFCAGMLLFFYDTAASFASEAYPNAFAVTFLLLAGLNFVGEFLVNLVFSPAMVRIIDIVKHTVKK